MNESETELPFDTPCKHRMGSGEFCKRRADEHPLPRVREGTRPHPDDHCFNPDGKCTRCGRPETSADGSLKDSVCVMLPHDYRLGGAEQSEGAVPMDLEDRVADYLLSVNRDDIRIGNAAATVIKMVTEALKHG